MNINPHRLSQLIRRAPGLALALLLFALPSAGGAAGSSHVTTSLMIPLNGSVFVNLGTQSEQVNLSGPIHLLTQVFQPGVPCQPGDPCRSSVSIHTNLAGVMGVGETSGLIYRLTGAQDFEFEEMLPISLFFLGSYRLTPGDPCRLLPVDPCRSEEHFLPVHFAVGISAEGAVTQAGARVGSVDSVDH
ncbi:MAG TPA: hypothetical protein VGL29_14825 [Blastocatellia bacterium]|jgi:hypothetical protein